MEKLFTKFVFMFVQKRVSGSSLDQLKAGYLRSVKVGNFKCVLGTPWNLRFVNIFVSINVASIQRNSVFGIDEEDCAS